VKTFCKRRIKYKRSEMWNELSVSMKSFPSTYQFSSNKLKHRCPQEFFWEVKATLHFLSLPSSFFPSPSLIPSPRCTPFLPIGHLNPAFGEGGKSANISWCFFHLPAPSSPLLFSHFPPFYFPSPFPLLSSFLPVPSLLRFLSPNLSYGLWSNGE